MCTAATNCLEPVTDTDCVDGRPTLWAPFSELQGRRLPLVIAMFGFTLFSIATATAKDLQTILICRFFGGFFGACPLAVVAAVFSDMFDNRTRGIAVTIFSMAVFTGPLLSPFIGGFIVESNLGWRWTEYLVSIMGFVAFALDFAFLEETYPPVILVSKAADLRRRTLNWGIHAKQEEIEVNFSELIQKNFSRPLRILFGEPIVLLLSIYMAFVYGKTFRLPRHGAKTKEPPPLAPPQGSSICSSRPTRLCSRASTTSRQALAVSPSSA